jgi:DNA-binding MarR family transcriptional regulator
MTDGASSPESDIARRLRDGFERIGAAMRAEHWARAGEAGLNPTQARALAFVAASPSGARVGAVAAHLGVTQPTATDSLAALTRKGLVGKTVDVADARAAALRATPLGEETAHGLAAAVTATDHALDTLTLAEKTALLDSVVKIIRALQNAGAISPQRLCATCDYFRPHAHQDAAAPHHCALVDAAFGAEALRLDCPEHVAAAPERAAEMWREFTRA